MEQDVQMKYKEKDFERVFDEKGYPDRNIKIGDLVLDDLTGTVSKVSQVTPKVGMDAWQGDMIRVASKCLDGYRHGWEVTKIRKRRE